MMAKRPVLGVVRSSRLRTLVASQVRVPGDASGPRTPKAPSTLLSTPKERIEDTSWTSKSLAGSSTPVLEPSAAPARLPRIAWPASRVAVFVRMRPPVLANEGETAVHAVRESGEDVPFTSIEVRSC